MRPLGVGLALVLIVSCGPSPLADVVEEVASVSADPVEPSTTTTSPTTTIVPTTSTTLAPIKIVVRFAGGVATPLNLWETDGPSRVGENTAAPVPVFIAWDPAEDLPAPRPAVLGIGLPIAGDFDGDGFDDLTTAGELFQTELQPRNAGCGTVDGLSDDFLPEPVGPLFFGPDSAFGACDTFIDLTQPVTVFVYSRQAGASGEPPLGDFIWTFEPFTQTGVLEGYMLIHPETGAGNLFSIDDELLYGDIAFDPKSVFVPGGP